MSAQTVSRITRDLDALITRFHQARLEDDWAYLVQDGVSLRVRRPSGRKRVHLLVAMRVKQMGGGSCWRLCAAGEKARLIGKAC